MVGCGISAWRQRLSESQRFLVFVTDACGHGAADTVSTVLRQTIRQLVTPNHLRGRMTSINMMFFMGGPQLGELEAGSLAALIGAPLSVVTGGLGSLICAAIAAVKSKSLMEFEIKMTWTAAETNTHQDHVIAHVIGATPWVISFGTKRHYILLDIGFIWNIYLDMEMGLVPQRLAISELDADEAMKSELRSGGSMVEWRRFFAH